MSRGSTVTRVAAVVLTGCATRCEGDARHVWTMLVRPTQTIVDSDDMDVKNLVPTHPHTTAHPTHRQGLHVPLSSFIFLLHGYGYGYGYIRGPSPVPPISNFTTKRHRRQEPGHTDNGTRTQAHRASNGTGTNLPTRVASAPCRLSCGDAAAPQTVEGLTRPPRTNAMPTSSSRARAEGVVDVLFGKPLLALGWGGLRGTPDCGD